MRRVPLYELTRLGTPFAKLVLRERYGFTPRQAERLVALKLGRGRSRRQASSPEYKRLLFARWLVRSGRLHER